MSQDAADLTTRLRRLKRMRSSPGVVLDRVDHEALTWAIELGEQEQGRLEAARTARAEDDTRPIGPVR